MLQSPALPAIILSKIRELGVEQELSLQFLKKEDITQKNERLRRQLASSLPASNPAAAAQRPPAAMEEGGGMLARYLSRPDIVKAMLQVCS
jgi:hypothetical protein